MNLASNENFDGHGWVVGIGASAGGLEALTLFVTNLPEDFAGTVIIAQHLAPHAKSMMVELLQRHSKLPVVSPQDGDKIMAGTIYVVPPNHDVDLTDNTIKLTVAGNETRPKPSVDGFFESLARAYGNRAIGIILSGTGSDGSEGIQAIKAVGGITLAQDDRSAKYDGMPRAAVNTGDVDSILSPEEMAKTLCTILTEHRARTEFNNLDGSGLTKILNLIKKTHGTDFKQYKASTIQRRVIRRMSTIGVKSFEEYVEILDRTPGELAQLAQEMLISVTSFFRDPEVFETAVESITKIISQKKTNEELRVWVAGCATGEEAYTLAILFSDAMERQRKHLPMKVFATDLDQDAILEARAGFYNDRECERIPTRILAKHFERRDGGYEVSKRLRDAVVFARQDMTQNPPFVKLDFISCRNVLIYFDNDLQRKVIEVFHYALCPSGTLLLGKSETVPVMTSLFKVVDRTAKIFMKLNVPSKPMAHARASQLPPVSSPRRRLAAGPSLAELSYLRLLNSYHLSGVTIDEECTILQVIGDVSPYLGFFTPQPDFRLTNLLPKDLGVEIPLLIRRVMKEGGTQRSRLYKRPERAERGPKAEAFYVVLRKLQDEDEPGSEERQLFIVNFEPKKKKELAPSLLNPDAQLPARVSELEQELFVTREHLQTVIEELGVSNEELQSLNEELSSTNEELQASGEELETTNEELQSSNEELTTLNEELNTKQGELRQLNISFENVQNSIGSPLIILDSQRRVIRYNPESLKIFAFSPADVGRDISRVSSNIEIDGFDNMIGAAISNGTSSETVTYLGSTVYQLRILPCLDEARSITGAILIFIDNTESLKSQAILTASDLRMKAIINGSDSIISLKDSVGRYVLINNAFIKFYGLDVTKVIGKTDRELFADQIAVPAREADLEVLVKSMSTRRQETIVSPLGEQRSFVSNRFPLIESPGSQPYAVGIVSVDITAQVQAQAELKKSQSRYRAIVEDQAVFVARHQSDGVLTYVNAPFTAQFGVQPELVGEKFDRIVAEIDKPRVAEALLQISPSSPIVQYEHRLAGGPPGSVRWVRWIHRGIFDQENRITEFQAVGFDVTESRQQTDQLIERDTIYTSVFDHTIDFLSVYQVKESELGDGSKAEFFLETFNRSTARAFGLANSQLVGRNLREFIDAQRVDEILEKYRKCVRTRKAELVDEQIEMPGGIRYFATTLVPIPGASGEIERVAATSRDVSGYKRIEADLRRAKEEADTANRSKSDFLASMSHELRTPLNVVLGMAQLLADSDLNQEQASFAGSIYRSGRLLLSLIEDVLDVAKIEAGKVTLESVSFCPADLVDEVLDLFKIQAKDRQIDLIGDISSEAGSIVVGDPARLRQILVNLVSNAIKFTDRGSVTIQATATCDRLRDECAFHFKVIDTGIGIPEEAHKRLFQRFSQVESGNSRRYGGSGLGLMISKQLVNLMGGTIGVESSRGKGSEFWVRITLPLSKQKTMAVQAATQQQVYQTPVLPGRPLKILAIDDNTESRSLIGHFLKKLGHQSILAGDAREAINHIQSRDFDVVLMDIQMPEMDGYEATAIIRSFPDQKAKLPIIALTANAMSGDADRAFQAGMDDYLSKPIDLEALRVLLDRWSVRLTVQ